jgi:hypothetical protein
MQFNRMNKNYADKIAAHPLWRWEAGMKAERFGPPAPDLSDVATVALIAQQARRMGETTSTIDRGGYEALRFEYQNGTTYWSADDVAIVYVQPLAKGWKVKGLASYEIEDDALHENEAQAWVAAWLHMAGFAIEVHGLDACRERFGIAGRVDGESLPLPLSVR